MMKLKMTACINAPKEDVWRVLADVENVHLWIDPIISASCENDETVGVGTVRTCKLKGNIAIREEWIEWMEGQSYKYKAVGAPLVKSAENTWSIKSEKGKTLLTTESTVELKGGILGKCLDPLMRIMSKRMGSDSLAAIKYLVENGQASKMKHSKLPRAAISC